MSRQATPHLSLAHAAIPVPNLVATVTTNDRKVFWHTFLDWLATATADETEQLEQVLAAHAHHVRPLIDAVSDALHDADSAKRLPPTLLAELVAANWQPRQDFSARAA